MDIKNCDQFMHIFFLLFISFAHSCESISVPPAEEALRLSSSPLSLISMKIGQIKDDLGFSDDTDVASKLITLLTEAQRLSARNEAKDYNIPSSGTLFDPLSSDPVQPIEPRLLGPFGHAIKHVIKHKKKKGSGKFKLKKTIAKVGIKGLILARGASHVTNFAVNHKPIADWGVTGLSDKSNEYSYSSSAKRLSNGECNHDCDPDLEGEPKPYVSMNSDRDLNSKYNYDDGYSNHGKTDKGVMAAMILLGKSPLRALISSRLLTGTHGHGHYHDHSHSHAKYPIHGKDPIHVHKHHPLEVDLHKKLNVLWNLAKTLPKAGIPGPLTASIGVLQKVHQVKSLAHSIIPDIKIQLPDFGPVLDKLVPPKPQSFKDFIPVVPREVSKYIGLPVIHTFPKSKGKLPYISADPYPDEPYGFSVSPPPRLHPAHSHQHAIFSKPPSGYPAFPAVHHPNYPAFPAMHHPKLDSKPITSQKYPDSSYSSSNLQPQYVQLNGQPQVNQGDLGSVLEKISALKKELDELKSEGNEKQKSSKSGVKLKNKRLKDQKTSASSEKKSGYGSVTRNAMNHKVKPNLTYKRYASPPVFLIPTDNQN